MFTVDRSTITKALYDVGLDPDEVLRENYSGRFMYGDECLGIVTDSPGDVFLFCAAIGASADDWDWVGNARSDGMGLSTIWYWPNVAIEEE